jgi:hypothetical protein
VADLDQVVQELKAKEPDRRFVVLSSKSAEAVFRVPSMKEMGPFRIKAQDKDQRGAATEWLVRTCCAHPAGLELSAILNAKPMLLEKWAEKLVAEAGADEEVEVKNF